MASDVSVGDSETATLLVSPADTDTTATLTVRPPTGNAYPATVSAGPLEPVTGSSDNQQLWTADTPVTYSAAGKWVLSWAVEGTGEGNEDFEVYVVGSPVAGGPTWTPGRSRVANYVPRRTLVRSPISVTGGQDQHAWTFDSTTTPPGVSVDRLIADGVAWVTALVTPLHATSHDLAALLASLHAAIAVERGWPNDDSSLQRANDMEKQLNTMLSALKVANQKALDDETGTVDGFDVVHAVYSFPPADLRWDYSGYW
jgi:hypothetical protein